MLDEAIDYLKSLQLQLQVLNVIISYAQVAILFFLSSATFSDFY
jgi:hypothetical protein